MPDSDLLPRFTSRFDGKPEPAAPEEDEIASGAAYATVTGQRTAKALEFIRQSGQSFTVPYGYAPLLWWNPPGLLLIEYPGLFTVALRGKQLGGLQRLLRDMRVAWIRESDAIEALSLPVAVTGIEIIQAFPSRDGNALAGEPFIQSPD